MAVLTYVIRFVDHGIARYQQNALVQGAYIELFSVSWVANIAIAALLLSIPGTSFEAGPLSNTSTVATMVVVLMFLYPALLSPFLGVGGRGGKYKEDDALPAGDDTEAYNNQMYEAIDTIARLVLTGAVALDIVMINSGGIAPAGVHA